MRSTLTTVLLFALIAGCTASTAQQSPDLPLDQIELPPGFSIHVYAEDVPNARAMYLTENGTLFVGSRRDGVVSAVVDEDGDMRGDRVYTVATGLHMPTGLTVRDGDLYVSEVSRILRFDNIEERLDDPPEPVVAVDGLPSDDWHGWKYIAFGPDGKLYVPVGVPCNICDPDPPYGTILRMNADGSEREVYARGVRNSVGFDWHPETDDFWFTDNGRDNIGVSAAEEGLIPEDEATAYTDSLPPDELNRVTEPGQHFGYPYVHGGTLPDPEYGEGQDPNDYVKPVQNLGPHVAALGMEFYDGTMFPDEYRHQAFIAEHGSWNRTEKIGYRVTLVRLDENHEAVSYEPFASGWLQGENNWGRPVDIELMPDGSMLVSDDQSGTIYRITYDG
jgi:glucose/arabinose dehydrogenase